MQRKNRAQILIVEDERLIVLELKRYIKQLGYRLAGVASSAEEAQACLVERIPDLILMDITLGQGMDGIELAERVKQEHGIPVVFLTGNSDKVTFQRAMDANPHGYVLKPFEHDELEAVLARVFDK